MWYDLYHTGPLQRECLNVKQTLRENYDKHKHKYKSTDIFHVNFKNSFSCVNNSTVPKEKQTFKCIIDEDTVNIPNPYLEGPCVFIGNHPLRGTCRTGVSKHDVTVNISPSHINELKQKGFISFIDNNKVKWFASWLDDITNERKYLFLPYDHDLIKFEKARSLKRKLHVIRKRNMELIGSNVFKDIQLGMASHLLDQLCIRIGNEKEYDTIGACSLTKNNVHMMSNRKVRFTFYGKDNIPFDRTIVLHEDFYKALHKCYENIELLQEKKIFHYINPSILNRYLSNFHKDITAKSFRTCKASLLFQNEFRKNNNKNTALLKVARLLNHKKLDKKTRKYVYNLSTSWNNYIDQRIYNDPNFRF